MTPPPRVPVSPHATTPRMLAMGAPCLDCTGWRLAVWLTEGIGCVLPCTACVQRAAREKQAREDRDVRLVWRVFVVGFAAFLVLTLTSFAACAGGLR